MSCSCFGASASKTRKGSGQANQDIDGLHYNPYFPGGAIVMPKMLNNGVVEYEDGTPATEAQVADGERCHNFLVLGCRARNGRKKTDGIQMDIRALIGFTPNRILPAIEVEYSQVPQADSVWLFVPTNSELLTKGYDPHK